MQQRTQQTTRSLGDGPAYRAAWLRFVLALCASFIAAGYVAAISHMSFVVHARCAEHGVLVHVDAGGHVLDMGAATSSASIDEGAGGSAGDEHDHCMLGGAQAGEARVPEAGHRLLSHADPPAAAPVPAPRPARALVPPPPPIALLLLSPKSSPPA